jgi:hypothetical protein
MHGHTRIQLIGWRGGKVRLRHRVSCRIIRYIGIRVISRDILICDLWFFRCISRQCVIRERVRWTTLSRCVAIRDDLIVWERIRVCLVGVRFNDFFVLVLVAIPFVVPFPVVLVAILDIPLVVLDIHLVGAIHLVVIVVVGIVLLVSSSVSGVLKNKSELLHQ